MINKPSPITRFEILGLYGDRDIIVDFDSPIKILVDENGSGKTTVLNTLFNVMTRNWAKLARLEFSTIQIHFPNDQKMSINRSDLRRGFDHLVNQADLHDGSSPNDGSYGDNVTHIQIRDSHSVSVINHYPDKSNLLRIDSPTYAKTPLLISDVSTKNEITTTRDFELTDLRDVLACPILYFPTYRRVEEDLHNLGYMKSDLNRDEQLIQFGMRDVKGRFEQITAGIRDSSVEWYSIINGRMLTQLIDGIRLEPTALDSLNNPATLRIVLDRIGNNIPNNDKEHLLKLVKSGEIKLPQYKTLAYFLSNLLQVYEQQQDKDHAIQNFARIVNGYLEDKEVIYNESKVQIKIVNKRSGKEVPLEKLSSGEKQIISIFSRLYLDELSQYAIIFDEPELSLSMEWQKKLLQDIVDSGRCVFLLAATHSPFIFDNDLDQFASVLDIRYLEDERDTS